MQVLSEGEQHILAATPAHPAGLYGKGKEGSWYHLHSLRYAVHLILEIVHRKKKTY
jgi:hypothetical protein